MADEKKGVSKFKTVKEISLPVASLVNTTKDGSSAVFKWIENTGELKDKGNGRTEEIHIVELYDEKEDAFKKVKTFFKSQISELVKSGQIEKGKIYKVTFIGRVKSKAGNPYNSYSVVEVSQ